MARLFQVNATATATVQRRTYVAHVCYTAWCEIMSGPCQLHLQHTDAHLNPMHDMHCDQRSQPRWMGDPWLL